MLLNQKLKLGAPVKINVDQDGESRELVGEITDFHYGVEDGELSVLIFAKLNGEAWEMVFPCSAKIL